LALRPCKECSKEISSDAKVCPHCGKKVASSGFGCGSVILVLIIIGVVSSALHHTDTGVSNPQPIVDPKAVALSQVSLDYTWSKGGFGNVMEATFTVKNNSAYNIKDFEITCRHFAKSGTEIDSNKRTIFDVVKAHSTRKFPNFNMGFIHSQAEQSSCKITELSIAQ
jgi:RNA polymerase subunit RPABC4/transcription elongation factor Spt4